MGIGGFASPLPFSMYTVRKYDPDQSMDYSWNFSVLVTYTMHVCILQDLRTACSGGARLVESILGGLDPQGLLE